MNTAVGSRGPKVARKITKRPEEDLQKAVVRFLWGARPDCQFFATTNQKGRRSTTEMRVLKAMGARAGVADLVFYRGGFIGFIELKAAKGTQSPAQEQFQAECDASGVPYMVCRSLAEVEGALKGWGVTLRGRLVA